MRFVPVSLSCIAALPLLATCAAPLAKEAVPAVVDEAPPSAPDAAPVTPQRTAAPASSRRVTITGAGDVLVHLKVAASARAHDAEGGFDWTFANLARVLPQEDLAFANLETPLTEDVVPVRSGSPPILGAPPAVAGALARAGFDVLSLANNHSFDQESTGLAETLSAVRSAGIVAIGAGRDIEHAHAPRLLDRNGVRVAFVGLTSYVNQCAGGRPAAADIADVDREEMVEESLTRAREIADVVVVAVHWSYDFEREPSDRQRDIARRLIDLGADVILGTGPHVLQSVERFASERGTALVAYSLGNLISNQGMRHRTGRLAPTDHFPMLDPAARDGVLLRVTVDVAADGRVMIDHVEAVPLWTENNFWARERGETERLDIRVIPLADAPADLAAARLEAIGDALGPSVVIAH